MNEWPNWCVINGFLETVMPGQILFLYACGSASSEGDPLLGGHMGAQGPEVVHSVGSGA